MSSQKTKKRKGNNNQSVLSFFKPKGQATASEEHLPLNNNTPEHVPTNPVNPQADIDTSVPPSTSQEQTTFDIDSVIGSLQRDPSKRIPIWKYPVNHRDAIRRAYINMGPYQPKLPTYKRVWFRTQYRRFNYNWFKKYKWLEYSASTDKAFCFPCYLFENEDSRHTTFSDPDTRYGDWLHVNGVNCAFSVHAGAGCPTSFHTAAQDSLLDLMAQDRHIDQLLVVQNAEEKKRNRFRFSIIIQAIRWLTMQGCALRGHHESQSSSNRGNFLEMLKLLGTLNPDIGEVLEMAPKNASYTSSDIQKDFLNVLANSVRAKIREEIGTSKFSILVDEAKDASNKEQMAIVLRYVDTKGLLRERFFAIVHVSDTTAATLKKAICNALSQYNLHACNMRGQGYDGASNMRGSWNGLQALFLKDSPYAYYVHCFAHRLQLALVAAAESESSVWLFFSKLNCIVNLIGSSPKRQVELQDAQAIEVENMVATGERETGRGANQVCNLQRAGKTRWGSHFESICSLVDMFGAVTSVLELIMKDGSSRSMRGEAAGCLREMEKFDFIFILHLMQRVMGITNLLCQALQGEAIDIVNAMDCVSNTKTLLQQLRTEGYEIHLVYVQTFCLKHDIEVPDMDALYGVGRLCQQRDSITFEHHYHFDIFHAVIDFQVEELNSRFNDDAMELLRLCSALEPKANFKSFNVDHICRLAERFYPSDFIGQDVYNLRCELAHYELGVVRHETFQDLTTITQLCQRLAETYKAEQYKLVDRLIRLILTLPVSTATTERAFSAMKLVKTTLRNKMEKDYLTDSMVVYIEREIAKGIDVDSIIADFYSKKKRRVQV